MRKLARMLAVLAHAPRGNAMVQYNVAFKQIVEMRELDAVPAALVVAHAVNAVAEIGGADAFATLGATPCA